MLMFGLTALILAGVGIYGQLACLAAARRREIATRKALGATERDVFWMMLHAGGRLAVAGIVIGLPAAYASGGAIAGSVFAMRATDPGVLGAACAIVGCVTAIAILDPAVKASRHDELHALRSD
jgi:ABC-type antimicrobial peptide transport system permease subunit